MASRRVATKAFQDAFPEREDFSLYEASARGARGQKRWEVVVYDETHSEGSYTAYVHPDGRVEGLY